VLFIRGLHRVGRFDPSLLDFEARHLKGRVAVRSADKVNLFRWKASPQPEPEFVSRRDVVLVEPLVVDGQALGEDGPRIRL
jgi:hypothetical protein